MRNCMMVVIVAVAAFYCPNVQALVMETVSVGNANNAADSTGYGAVGYEYCIGKFEVTAGQYTEFLNAVAATDPYGLYTTNMGYMVDGIGCGIRRNGSQGNYSYLLIGHRDRPVNSISWADAARFANWMHNGQGSGDTETGSYDLSGTQPYYTPDGLIDDLLGLNVAISMIQREAGATWVIPSEDEWYKAAYHKNDGITGNYFDLPMSNDSPPSNDLITPDPGNNATYRDGSGYTIGEPYYRTVVGAHVNSESPYGTFDQGGNVSEWNEAIGNGSLATRGRRGGSYFGAALGLYADYRHTVPPGHGSSSSGFRLAYVPEPASLTLLALGGLVVLRRR